MPRTVAGDPLRLCILEADDLPEHLVTKFRGYGDMLTVLMEEKQPIPVQCSIYRVHEGKYPAKEEIEKFDAYIISGSKADAFGTDAWIVELREFIRQMYERKAPLLGVCFGHQVIAVALGGSVERASVGWCVGANYYHVESFFRRVSSPNSCSTSATSLADGATSLKAEWAEPRREKVKLLASHRDQVTRLPPNTLIFAHNEFCPIAGYFEPRRIFCLQGHPEFEPSYARELCQYRRSILGEQLFQKALPTFDDNDFDGSVIAHYMARFILQAKHFRLTCNA